MKTFILGVLIFMLSIHSQAQELDTSVKPQGQEMGHSQSAYLYIPISSLFEKYGSFNLGIQKDWKISSAGFELGYVFDTQEYFSFGGFEENEVDMASQNTYGVKLLVNYRFLLDESDNSWSKSKLYIELLPYLYYVNTTSEVIGGFQCGDPNNGCNYYQLFDSQMDRWVTGFYLGLLRVYNFDRFLISGSASLGLRKHIDNYNNLIVNEPDFYYNREGDELSNDSEFNSNFRIAFTIGYKLR